jgi:hypothetical protein
LGGLLYDKIFAGKKDKEKGDKDLKGDGDDSGTTERTSQSFTTRGGPEAEQLKNQMASDLNQRTTISSEMDPAVAAKRLALEKQKRQFKRGSEERKNIESQIAELRSGSPISSNQKTNNYSGLDTYADYEEDSGSKTYVVTQKSNPTTNTGTDQGGGVEQAQLASLSLHSSNESGSNWSDELQKR